MQYAKYKFLLFCLLLGLGIAQAYSQCAEPEASIWENTWHSCEVAVSPNTERGDGHWIQYDFGRVYTLSSGHVWNTNAIAQLQQGFREVAVDYSIDGEEWLTLDTVTFAQGTGQATYGGFTAFDFEGDSARYVLLTALSNYGHPSCYGLAEVKFNLTLNMEGTPEDECDDPPCEDEDEDECDVPSFATAFVINSEEAFIRWEYVEAALTRFRFREEAGEWVEVYVEEGEPEVLLEGLAPETTYEYQIGVECLEEELRYGQSFYFTTTPWLEECSTPLVSDWIFYEDDEYLLISCNEVPDAEGYVLRYREEGTGNAWIEIPSEENFWEFEDFEGEVVFEYQIRAFCPEGDTGFSELFVLDVQNLVFTVTQEKAADIQLFPNPTRGVVNLAVTVPNAGALNIRVYNLTGQIALHEVYQVSGGRHGLVLPTGNLRAGVYTVNIYQEESGLSGVHKLIVTK